MRRPGRRQVLRDHEEPGRLPERLRQPEHLTSRVRPTSEGRCPRAPRGGPDPAGGQPPVPDGLDEEPRGGPRGPGPHGPRLLPARLLGRRGVRFRHGRLDRRAAQAEGEFRGALGEARALYEHGARARRSSRGEPAAQGAARLLPGRRVPAHRRAGSSPRIPENLYSTITIDKGFDDGIRKNMPVIAFQDGVEGLVGQDRRSRPRARARSCPSTTPSPLSLPDSPGVPDRGSRGRAGLPRLSPRSCAS